jgi:hypothetical protein
MRSPFPRPVQPLFFFSFFSSFFYNFNLANRELNRTMKWLARRLAAYAPRQQPGSVAHTQVQTLSRSGGHLKVSTTLKVGRRCGAGQDLKLNALVALRKGPSIPAAPVKAPAVRLSRRSKILPRAARCYPSSCA